jgi:cytochrome c-type biogenesis protein CcmE
MAHSRFVFLGIGGVIALVVAFTFAGLNDNLTYYLYPNEAMAQKAEFPDGTAFRLAGTVVEGSIVESDDSVTFEVTDGAATIPVVLDGPPPALFEDGVPVLLEGSWSGGDYLANDALIKHDENYTAPDQGGAYDTPD